jgi:D-alanyl-D-alanine carboxypeptidase/D-alanyl-D-alanine-endopeptidase (penicillin-binding protein 4)
MCLCWRGPVGQANRVAWRSDVAMNPASTMKLLTTFAGLELLGPGYRWNTGVFRQGEVVDGVLRGNLWIRGSGDPRLTLEQLWLLLRQIKLRGVRRIEGDILLDPQSLATAAGRGV